MTFEQSIAVAAVAGLLVGAGALWMMLRLVRRSIAQPPQAALTPQQLRDMSDLAQQLQRLMNDIDAKIGTHLSRLDQAMLQADARTELLRQTTEPHPANLPDHIEAETAVQPIWSPPTDISPAEEPAEDEPVTLPGTWPIPPSRPEQNSTPLPLPRNSAQLQSPRHVEVLRLHRKSEAAETIARKLQMDLGEVELVLRLHGAGEPK